MKSMLESFNFMVDASMVAQPKEAGAEPQGTAVLQDPVRLALYCKGKSGVMEAWEQLELQIEPDQQATAVTIQARVQNVY